MNTSINKPTNSNALGIFRQRHHFIHALREFFIGGHDFIEIDTPLLVSNPGLEPHLEYFQTEYKPSMSAGTKQTYYLPTSPEYALKKALSTGLERVFEITPSFRNGEASPKHRPEFLMLEWYRHPGSYKDIAEDVKKLFAFMAERFSSSAQDWLNFKDWTVCEAFQKFCNIDLEELLRTGNQQKLASLAIAEAIAGITDEMDFEECFHRLMLDRVEPAVKKVGGVVFLWDYPVEFAALARKKENAPYLSERFEVYFDGIELGNAFGELTDPEEQRRRCEADLASRAELYPHEPQPSVDEEFLAGLSRMQPAGGIAMGVERLMMCLLGQSDLKSVRPFENLPKK